jgi:hypothetical protein
MARIKNKRAIVAIVFLAGVVAPISIYMAASALYDAATSAIQTKARAWADDVFGDAKIAPYTGRPVEEEEGVFLGPEDQIRFLQIVLGMRERFLAEPVEILRAEMRVDRAEALCRAMASRKFNPWLATFDGAGVSSDGQGFDSVHLSLHENIQLYDRRGASRGTPLYARLREIRQGDKVLVSGEFVYDKGDQANDCFEELRLTLRGGMERPRYRVRLLDIVKWDGSGSQ